MANRSERLPINVRGRYYIDVNCTDCDACRQLAPGNVKRDDRVGYAYVFKQPENPEEEAALQVAVVSCPTEAVGADGEDGDEMYPYWDDLLNGTGPYSRKTTVEPAQGFWARWWQKLKSNKL